MKLRLLIAVLSLAACTRAVAEEGLKAPEVIPQTMVRMAGTQYQFLFNCCAFTIKGAIATNRLAELAAAGGNCVLAPDLASADGILDRARDAGLMGAVLVQLEQNAALAYANTQAVAAAIEAIRPQINRLKAHPRLLFWVITSRVTGAESGNAAAYRAVNRLARMIRDEDPDRIIVGDVGLLVAQDIKAKLSAENCPELDALGFTPGAATTNLVQLLNGTGWYKPFVVLNVGAPPSTSARHAAWGAPIEPLPSDKTAWCLFLLTNAIPVADGRCLGSIAYNWDASALVTPTWYSLHHADGSPSELVDALTLAWTGHDPDNRAPVITALTSAVNARLVSPGAVETATVVASDPDGDKLTYSWVLRRETRDSGTDGRMPAEYVDIGDAIKDAAKPGVTFTVPAEAGPYRLFVYVRDNKGHATSANIPLLVEAVRAPITTIPQPATPAEPGTPVSTATTGSAEAVDGVVTGKPAHVTIEKTGVGGGWMLKVDGAPFFIKGAGGKKNLDELQQAGANAIRTWSTDFAGTVLDDAQRHGLKVCLGLWMKQERHGFDYKDRAAVDAQLQKLRSAVRRYRNHPALLMWCCGIEVEWGEGTNAAVYKAINQVARMVHEEDPNHPSATAFADLGYNNVKAALAAQYCPDLDIFGVNSYGGLRTMADRLRSMGWSRPYMIMEFGPKGPWEVDRTSWGSEVEQMPMDKAAFYLDSYNKSISSQENWCLGSFVFSWDYKFECTPTWFSMHLLDGSRLNTVDTMWRAWSGRDPTNRCPQIRWVGSPLDRSKVAPGKVQTLDVDATDPDGDALQYQWILMSETKTKGPDGVINTELKPVGGRIAGENQRKARITAPTASGAYRVFIYVRDGKGNASAANMTFFVEPPNKTGAAAATNAPATSP